MGHLIRDGVIIGGTNVYVDDSLSTTSENPVQNKVITNELNNKVNTSDLSNVAITGDYNDLIDKPIIDNTLSNQSTNAVQNKVVTESLNNKYSFNYDVCLSLDEWEALDSSKYFDHKNYYIYDVAEHQLKPVIYGYHVDPDESDPYEAVTYLKDAVGMTPAKMGTTNFSYGSWENAFFMPKPCMLKFDGTVDYYLDPNDYTKKLDGIPSDVANQNYDGNAMMEWPLIWYKFEPGTAEGEGYFYVSNIRVDDSYHCWCNYDANDNIIDHFYTAIYNATIFDNKMRSLSGYALTSANGNGYTTGPQEVSAATANNTTNTVEWYINVWADWMLIAGLTILMGKSLNVQKTFGHGMSGILNGASSRKQSYITGTANDKGLFYGNTTDTNTVVKVFGMENLWGCVMHRMVGITANSTNYLYKLTWGNADGSTTVGYNTSATGYLTGSTRYNGSGYIKTCTYGKQGFMAKEAGSPASASTYYCDFYYMEGYTNVETSQPTVGGCTFDGDASGFKIQLAGEFSVSNWNVSSVLSCKPLKS